MNGNTRPGFASVVPQQNCQGEISSNPPTKIDVTASEDITFVHETLKLLFHCVLVEYIECAIPLLYAVYLSILFHLPNAKYYPQTASMTEDRLSSTILNLIIYVWLEVASFAGLHFALKRKFDFPPVYVLGFVLETQASQLQGRLFVWIIYILQFTLVHFGRSNSLRQHEALEFAWSS